MSKQREEPSQRLDRPAVQLTVYVAEPHVGGRRSKVDELLRRAAAAGVSGGTVVGAFQGFGRRHSHEPTLWHRADETPLTAVFVDLPERIATLLTLVDEVLPDAVAVTEQVRAIRYIRPHQHEPS
jgi:PII-like signaling protein